MQSNMLHAALFDGSVREAKPGSTACLAPPQLASCRYVQLISSHATALNKAALIQHCLFQLPPLSYSDVRVHYGRGGNMARANAKGKEESFLALET